MYSRYVHVHVRVPQTASARRSGGGSNAENPIGIKSDHDCSNVLGLNDDLAVFFLAASDCLDDRSFCCRAFIGARIGRLVYNGRLSPPQVKGHVRKGWLTTTVIPTEDLRFEEKYPQQAIMSLICTIHHQPPKLILFSHQFEKTRHTTPLPNPWPPLLLTTYK